MTTLFILTVSNRKGGSGKTTTVVNLAAEWASRDRKALVIDLDTQGHAGFGLGVDPVDSAPTAHDVFRDPADELASAWRRPQARASEIEPRSSDHKKVS
jgi:chromosome partitioning protein